MYCIDATPIRKFLRERNEKAKLVVGVEIEQSELTEELSRYWPRIYGGILNHFGTQHEARILAFIKEAVHDREFVLRGQWVC